MVDQPSAAISVRYVLEVYKIKAFLNLAFWEKQQHVKCYKIWWIHQVYYCFVITPTSQPNRLVIIGIITRAFRRKRPRYKFGFVFFAFSHKTQFHYSACVKCRRMRRMNLREHGLKQWLPSWTTPCLMYAKEIRWLLGPIYIKSYTPFVVDPH